MIDGFNKSHTNIYAARSTRIY